MTAEQIYKVCMITEKGAIYTIRPFPPQIVIDKLVSVFQNSFWKSLEIVIKIIIIKGLKPFIAAF